MVSDTVQAAFERFHAENPHVFDLLVRFTNETRARGYRHYSIRAVFERIRWHVNVETRGPDEFKLNNNYASRYTRLLERERPDLAGFYRTRELKRL